jgi:hypothetical protein
MPAYVVVDILVTDPSAYEEYKRLASLSIQAFGGSYLVRGGASQVLEGSWQPKIGSCSSSSTPSNERKPGTRRPSTHEPRRRGTTAPSSTWSPWAASERLHSHSASRHLTTVSLTRRCSGLATLAAELHFVRPRGQSIHARPFTTGDRALECGVRLAS